MHVVFATGTKVKLHKLLGAEELAVTSDSMPSATLRFLDLIMHCKTSCPLSRGVALFLASELR